jgi:acyl-CoA thioester hydrolase
VPEALTVWREPVQDAWIDYNGHVSEPYYVLVMGHATDAVMAALGMGPDYQAAHDSSFYTVEAHVRYVGEIRAGVELEVRSSVIGHSSKLAWFWHELWAEGRLRATEEILGVHVTAGSSSPFPGNVLARLGEVTVDPPEEASRRISLARR